MYNELYDVTLLKDNIQERIIKNYEIAANRSRIGLMAGECFWNRQVLADMLMRALSFTESSDPERYEKLYNIYLKISV